MHGREQVLWVRGPVKPSADLVLHRRKDVDERGAEVRPGLFLGGSPQLLVELLKTSGPNPAPGVFRVVRGYAGWAPGQLAREVREGSWRVADSDADVLFGAEGELLWDDVLVRSQLPFPLPSHTLRAARLN